MKATCIRDQNHDEFVTNVTVRQEWIVDKCGGHIEVKDDFAGLLSGPDLNEIWTCNICGCPAKTEK